MATSLSAPKPTTPGEGTDSTLERARMEAILDAMDGIVLTAELTGQITSANAAARSALGVLDMAKGGPKIVDDVLDDSAKRLFADEIVARLAGDGRWKGDLRLRGTGGNVLNVSAVFVAHRGRKGKVTHVSMVATDRSEHLALEHRLAELERGDRMTGQSNMSALSLRLGNALARHRRLGHPVGLFVCQLTGLDAVGSEAASVLAETGGRIRSVVRETDTIAYAGGAEFVVLCEGVESPAALEEFADRVVEAIEEPVEISTGRQAFGISVGTALAAPTRDLPVTLLAAADAAISPRRFDVGNLAVPQA